MKTNATLRFAMAALVTFTSSLSLAQEGYPTKPVRFIAPCPPGGSSDVLARVIAQKLTDALGRQVIVENRPGATGNIGHEVAAKSPPDGYTLLLTTKSQMVNNPYLFKRLPFDPLNDFSLLSLIANAGHVLAVSDVVGGQIEMVFSDMVPAVPQIRGGRLRALAVTTEQRSPALADVPTMIESGMKEPLPTQWWGMSGPRGMPSAIAARLNSEIGRILSLPDVKQRYNDLGIMPMHTSPERMLELIRTEIPQMAQILAAIGLKPE